MIKGPANLDCRHAKTRTPGSTVKNRFKTEIPLVRSTPRQGTSYMRTDKMGRENEGRKTNRKDLSHGRKSTIL